MIRNRVTALFGLGLLLAGAGCVSCGHETTPLAVEAGPYCAEPACDRRHVYAILINGLDPSGSLDPLRLKLAERGFEKIYRGELCHVWWLWHEMKRVRKCDPEARFVLVGYGFGCTPLAGLAKDAARQGIPVDSVVLLDPAGVKDPHACAENTIVIRAGLDVEESAEEHCIRVRTCSHFGLPVHEQTVDAIAVALAECAMRVEHVEEVDPPIFWHEDAPPPRSFTIPDGSASEWLFLHERLGPHTAPVGSNLR